MLPYLILLRAEFGCFHSSGSTLGPTLPIAQLCQLLGALSGRHPPVPGLSVNALDILSVPLFLNIFDLAVSTLEGRYPLRSPAESGLSSQKLNQRTTGFSAIIHKTELLEVVTRFGNELNGLKSVGFARALS